MGLGDFFRDYGTPFASAVAVLNGFIAVLIAQLFQDYPIAKMFLVVSAGLLGAAAICVTFYTQRQIVATRDAEAARRLAIREWLGSFVAEGNHLMNSLDPTKSVPLDQTNEWANRVEVFLLTKLGQSYVNRFRDWTGTPSVQPPAVLDSEHQKAWAQIYFRVFRLEQFSQQLPI